MKESITDTEQVLHWKNTQVLYYLESFKMAPLIDKFKSHHITGKDLLELTEKDITRYLNITDLHMVKKLCRHIAKLRNISQSDCIFSFTFRLHCKSLLFLRGSSI